MGSCFCMRKSNLIIEEQNIADELKHKPYRWAVINPRPSGNSFAIYHEQAQPKQVALQRVSSYFYLKSESQYPWTCLDMLNLSPKKFNELATTGQSTQQGQEVMSTKSIVETGVSLQNRSPLNSPKPLGEYWNKYLDDATGAAFSRNKHSAFLDSIVVVGESDSSPDGTPQKYLVKQNL